MPRMAGVSRKSKQIRKRMARLKKRRPKNISTKFVIGRLPTIFPRKAVWVSRGAKVERRSGETDRDMIKRFKHIVRKGK